MSLGRTFLPCMGGMSLTRGLRLCGFNGESKCERTDGGGKCEPNGIERALDCRMETDDFLYDDINKDEIKGKKLKLNPGPKENNPGNYEYLNADYNGTIPAGPFMTALHAVDDVVHQVGQNGELTLKYCEPPRDLTGKWTTGTLSVEPDVNHQKLTVTKTVLGCAPKTLSLQVQKLSEVEDMKTLQFKAMAEEAGMLHGFEQMSKATGNAVALGSPYEIYDTTWNTSDVDLWAKSQAVKDYIMLVNTDMHPHSLKYREEFLRKPIKLENGNIDMAAAVYASGRKAVRDRVEQNWEQMTNEFKRLKNKEELDLADAELIPTFSEACIRICFCPGQILPNHRDDFMEKNRGKGFKSFEVQNGRCVATELQEFASGRPEQWKLLAEHDMPGCSWRQENMMFGNYKSSGKLIERLQGVTSFKECNILFYMDHENNKEGKFDKESADAWNTSIENKRHLLSDWLSSDENCDPLCVDRCDCKTEVIPGMKHFICTSEALGAWEDIKSAKELAGSTCQSVEKLVAKAGSVGNDYKAKAGDYVVDCWNTSKLASDCLLWDLTKWDEMKQHVSEQGFGAVDGEEFEKRAMATYIAAFRAMKNSGMFPGLDWDLWKKTAKFYTRNASINYYPAIKATGKQMQTICNAFPALARRVLVPFLHPVSTTRLGVPDFVFGEDGSCLRQGKGSGASVEENEVGYFYVRVANKDRLPMFTGAETWERDHYRLQRPSVLGGPLNAADAKAGKGREPLDLVEYDAFHESCHGIEGFPQNAKRLAAKGFP